MLDRDDPGLEDICDYCDEDPTICGRCVEECMTEAEERAAEDRYESERDERD